MTDSERLTRVSNEPLRDRFKHLEARGEMSLYALAKALGWARSNGRPDSNRVQRALGIAPEHGRIKKTIRYENAVSIARALDMDPVDAGI